MDESRTGDIPQVTDQENERLTTDFTEKEVRGAIFQMKAVQKNSIRFFGVSSNMT